ncbi:MULTISPECIES: hypothetical protein [Providencia]|nr:MULTISPECIES: hypothetical protein [Providencia]MCX9096195.1 hypothetical protein [Providencia rettgeri]MDM9284917.1 hypothetical protein [Providencia rettgeri]WOB80888.1 hypothetical protein P3L37_14385 [Providencia sp. PROV114]HEE8951257.1 hypothetical protein [Providencia rettgeri]
MNFKKMSSSFVGIIALSSILGGAVIANAADGVERKITLTAQISDGIYVTKPDGKTWYTTEELESVDHKQSAFAKTLDVRVWTKGEKFNVSMIQPLIIQRNDGAYRLKDTKVSFGGPANILDYGKPPVSITQTLVGDGGFDDIYKLNIGATAPTSTGAAGETNGAYSGDLVMLFEPSA